MQQCTFNTVDQFKYEITCHLSKKQVIVAKNTKTKHDNVHENFYYSTEHRT